MKPCIGPPDAVPYEAAQHQNILHIQVCSKQTLEATAYVAKLAELL